MPTVMQRAFGGGEITPLAHARADVQQYQTGLKTCLNAIVQRHGGVTNRPGTRMICEVKLSANRTYLINFVFNDDQTYVIEAGDFYFRFIRLGVQLGAPYEIATPYAVADIPTLQWVQQNDVVTLTHPSYQPRELRRTGHTAWSITLVTTSPSIAAPTGIGSGGGLAGSQTIQYLVTAVKAETYEESIGSAVVTRTLVAEPTAADPIATTWSAVAGAVEYRVYKDSYGNGQFGYIGSTPNLFFNDVGFLPDFLQGPPLARVLFQTPNNYPSVAAYYQQRRIFANTNLEPETVWASRIGFYSNFSISSPLQDDDAVTFIIAGNQVQPVRFLLGLNRLLLLTAAGEWKIQGDESGALVPTSVNPDQQSWIGVSTARPAVVGNTVIFVQARNSLVRELRVDNAVQGLGGRDLTIYANHLFEGKTISRIALAQIPNSVVWAVRSDGVLLGLTYIPEDETFGWHQHTTDGFFEDVCVVPEGTEDAVYVVVRRTIGGVTKRFIERFESRLIVTPATDAFFQDCGVRYSGASTATITGLSHLNGETVSVIADGVALEQTFIVSGGAITLPAAVTRAVVGLPYTTDLESLEPDGESGIRDRRKVIRGVSLVVDKTSAGFEIGRTLDETVPVRVEDWQASEYFTGAMEAQVATGWGKEGKIAIRHTLPAPLTVLAFMPMVDFGG